MTKQDVLDHVQAGRTENLYYVDLFQQDLVKKGYYLGVRFESVQPVLLENMGWLLLASGFCVFGLLFVFYHDHHDYHEAAKAIGHQERIHQQHDA